MISTAMIGSLSLNLSFVLYLLVYLPQIIHNRTSHHLSSLSMGMHFILYSSYCLDLVYGFLRDLPWQYKTVSIVSLTLLVIQHLQITTHCQLEKKWGWFYFNVLFIVTTGIAVLCFFIINRTGCSNETTQAIGYLSRVGFLMYTLPQIIKNRALKSSHAISIQYIYLSMMLSLLDMISAWSLDWGWPNKLGSPFTLLLLFIMLRQVNRYGTKSPAFPSSVSSTLNFKR